MAGETHMTGSFKNTSDATAPGPSQALPPFRQGICGTAVILSTGSLAVFYGMPANAVLFCGAVFALLAAATLIGPSRAAVSGACQPAPTALALAALFVLVAAYEFSLSKDTSFAPTWSLALLPLAFLVTRELGAWRWRVHAVLSALVFLFAALSLGRFVALDERPSLPLTDPNNYCSLVYMAFIPWAYVYLNRCWSDRSVGWPEHMAAQLGSVVMVSVIFATQSRAGSAIVMGALAIFLAVGISRRRQLWPVIAMVAITVAAYLLLLETPTRASRFSAQEISQGVDARVTLNAAALDIYVRHPLTGAGINVFPLLYRMGRDPLDQETAGLSAHNDYLQLLAEGGPLMLIMLLAFAGVVGWRFLRALFGDRGKVPGPAFGVLMALGAVLAHAAVNFVLMTSILAAFIGLSAALVPWQQTSGRLAGTVDRWKMLLGGALLWGWASFAYLALDTFSLGVYERQAGVPFAAFFSSDRDRLLAYSRFVQVVNGDRGVPVLAEATVYQTRLADSPDSEYLRDLTLHTYRRALGVDPWNPNVWLQFHDLVTRFPELQDSLSRSEHPLALLERAITLDPIFLPAYERLIATFQEQGRPELGYRLVRERLGPWLVWLSLRDQVAAGFYLDYLRDWAQREGDRAYLQSLEVTRNAMVKRPMPPRRLWFH